MVDDREWRLVMKFTSMLKRLLAPERGRRRPGRRYSSLPRLDELEFSVIPATEDRLYDQDVRPALLAQILSAEKGRRDRSGTPRPGISRA
jgi:hypothetical protein